MQYVLAKSIWQQLAAISLWDVHRCYFVTLKFWLQLLVKCYVRWSMSRSLSTRTIVKTATIRDSLTSCGILRYVGGIQDRYNMEKKGDAVPAGTQCKEKTLLSCNCREHHLPTSLSVWGIVQKETCFKSWGDSLVLDSHLHGAGGF